MSKLDVTRSEQIMEHEKATFRCLFDDDFHDRLALVRCYLDGVPTTTVCLVDKDERAGDYILSPLYVGITDDMDLRGPDGSPLAPMIQN